MFSHGDLLPRHTKVRHFSCVAFSPTVFRIFAWRGERSPRETPPKSPFGAFSRGDLSPRQEKIRQTGANTRKVATQKNRQMLTFSCFRMATFRPATRKHATFHALRFRLLFIVSLPGEAKGRHAKTRKNHLLACFRVVTFRVFAPENTFIRHDINQPPYKPEYRTRILAIMCTCAPRYFDTHLSENNIVLLLL